MMRKLGQLREGLLQNYPRLATPLGMAAP